MKKTITSILGFAALCACFDSWPADPAPRSGAWGIVDRVQSARHEAQTLAKPDAKPQDLDKAAKILEGAIEELDTPDARAFAEGNNTLFFRRYDALRDLAAVHALMGRREEALHELELMQQVAILPAISKLLLAMPEFASLRDEPRFRAIIDTNETVHHLWSAPHIATPYKEKLTVEERIAGLSLFWAEARQSFVYFDHVPDVDWDAVYLEYIHRVTAAKTTEDYYRVMMQLAPILRDGHTNIYPPKELQPLFYSRPPLRTARIAGKVYVTEVFSPSLASRVRPGEEIIAIDGKPVDEYAGTEVAPYVSSSTMQDREVRTYSYQLLGGDRARSIEMKLRAPDASTHVETVDRTGYSDAIFPQPFAFRMLPGDIAYLSVDHFESDAPVKAFEAALPKILGAKGLVLDLRHNGGGSTGYGLAILSYLTSEPMQVAKQRYRDDPGFIRSRAEMIRWMPAHEFGPQTIPRKEHFTGPVALLIGPQTFSAAEDFVMSFDVAKRGILVGTATAGSTGQPMQFALPGGGTARICVKRDTYPDGREFVGKGIAPNVEVSMTAQDLRAGRDPVLDRAVAELSKAR